MKEREFINIIKNTLNSKYIGDDCAYLPELGIVVTQDSLVEGVHFLREKISPYELGFKSAAVNISDVCASGAEPKYLTSAISFPDNTDENFIKEFYKGMQDGAMGAEIIGGDITGADKIYISVTAIGTTAGRRIASRKNAKPGQKIIVSGNHGSSAAGLKLLLSGQDKNNKFIKAHIMPNVQLEFSKRIAAEIKEDYAMMDTSDGLMDALSAISSESGVMLEVDFDKIPHDKDLESFDNWEDLVLFGGEDYGLVAAASDAYGGTVIGNVLPGYGVKINYKNSSVIYSKEDVEKNLFKHFKE